MTIVMATTSNKLEICEVCAADKAKYTCPKCEVRTCGLSCINIHKKELQCSGIRDKMKYIPLHSFTDLDLLSDYRMLEDIGRSVEQLQKNPSKKCTRLTHLPLHLHRMKCAASKRSTNLEFMPQNFSRNKENTTFFNWKENKFFWKVELIFPQAENIKWAIEKVLETKRLSAVLEEVINVDPLAKSENDELSNKLTVLQSKLKFYRACGLTGLRTLLKAEKVKKSDSRFYELDLDLSLQENLKNKTIIEFPTVYVILKDHSHMFDIVDSDDEEMKSENTKPQRKRNLETQKKIIKEEKVDSSVNYFFNGEISDSEDEDNPEMNYHQNKNNELFIPDYNELVKMKH